MSRVATYQTAIVIPRRQLPRPDPRTGALNIPPHSLCFDALRRALTKVANDHGGIVLYSPEALYIDCRGQRHLCLIAIHTADFPRGIGLNIDEDGRLTFVYDGAREGDAAGKFLVQPEVAQRICDEIAKHYATIAVLRAQASLGFQVSVQPLNLPGQQAVLVTGVKP